MKPENKAKVIEVLEEGYRNGRPPAWLPVPNEGKPFLHSYREVLEIKEQWELESGVSPHIYRGFTMI